MTCNFERRLNEPVEVGAAAQGCVFFVCVCLCPGHVFHHLRKLEEKLGAKLDGEELLPVVWGQKHVRG